MVIGITGSIATGKSVVTKYLRSKGVQVIDADEIVHDLYLQEDIIQEIGHRFGNELIKNKKVDRKKLGEIIFNNPSKRKELNSFIHPLVASKIIEATKAYKNTYGNLVFVEIPLLYEEGLEYLCDKIIVVYVPVDIQVTRLMLRDKIAEDYANKKIAASMDIEEKKQKADYVIDNSFDLSMTYKNIYEVLGRLENEI